MTSSFRLSQLAAAVLSLMVLPATAEEGSPADTPADPDTIVVEGDRHHDYGAPASPSATKTDTPLIDVPQSVQIVTREVLEDQVVLSIADATRNVAGVTGAFGFSGPGNGCVRVRGFTTEQGSVGCTYYRDGMRVWAQPLPFAAVESVEVIKGPASVLYGRNEPGGIVNVVTLKPEFRRIASISQTAGSFDTSITRVDLNNTLDEARTLAGRLTAAYSATDTSRREVIDRLADINAGLAWQPSANTRVDLGVDYTLYQYQPDFGVPALGDRPAPVSVRQSYKQDYVTAETEATVVTLGLDQKLTQDWSLRARAFGSYQTPNYFSVYTFGLDEATLQLPVFYFAEQYSSRRTYQGNLDAIGKFSTAGIEHTVLVGVDYNHEDYDGPIYFAEDGQVDPADDTRTINAPALDLFDPQLGSADRIRPTREDFSPYGSIQRWTGLYVQDQIAFGERWIVNLGLRRDHAKFAFAPDPKAALVTETTTKPRAGVVFKATPQVSVFAQYQEAFAPSNGRSASDEAFPSQEATEVQTGAKWQSADQRFLATVALFDLRKENLVTGDPSTPDPTDRVAVGEVRNRGLEIDASGQLTPQLSLIASYAYSDSEQSKDGNGNEGKRYEGVPRHAGSLWSRWQFTPQLASGLGVFAEGSRNGDLANSYQLPGYARVDAMAQVAFRAFGAKLTAQLNVNNLFDTDYYAGIYNNSRDFISPGTTRQVLGSLRADF